MKITLPPLFAFLFLFVFLYPSHGEKDKRPNIIVFLVDDYDKPETSPYGGKVLTPNLNRLAKEGMICHNAHVTSTVCTPSRYTFLTGRYASSSHSNTFLEECPESTQALPAFNVGLESDRMNVGRVLADAGYATGFVGKYHVHDTDHSKEGSLFGDLDVAKNAEYSEKLNKRKFKLEKLQRDLVKKNGFTWAKNIYWGNLKQPFKGHNPGLDRTGRPGVYRGAQGSAFLFALLLHPASRTKWRMVQVNDGKRAGNWRGLPEKTLGIDRSEIGMGTYSKGRPNRSGGRLPLDGR